MHAGDTCPLTGAKGVPRRERDARELADSYRRFHGASLPDAIIRKYFTETIREYECTESGLRWYSPAPIGEEDLYATLSEVFPWYYQGLLWDKNLVTERIAAMRDPVVVDIGCGAGMVLQNLKARGVRAFGIDTNQRAVAQAKATGLFAFHTDDTLPADLPVPTVLTMLQVIEHVPDPLAFVRRCVDRFPCETLLISAPCWPSLLACTSDPLAWPPHHCTAWSLRAFKILARRTGYTVTHAEYMPSTLAVVRDMCKRELPRLPAGIPAAVNTKMGGMIYAWHKLRGAPWARHAHSICVTLKRDAST